MVTPDDALTSVPAGAAWAPPGGPEHALALWRGDRQGTWRSEEPFATVDHAQKRVRGTECYPGDSVADLPKRAAMRNRYMIKPTPALPVRNVKTR